MILDRSNRTQLSTTCRRCDVYLELCCPGAKPRRLALPFVTRFGVIPEYDEDMTFLH